MEAGSSGVGAHQADGDDAGQDRVQEEKLEGGVKSAGGGDIKQQKLPPGANHEEARPGVITRASDLSRPDRRIWVVTTASLPWRTGTAVNPLLRALYLTRGRKKHSVTLLVPWLESTASQEKLYGRVFRNQNEQEEWVREYCRHRAECTGKKDKLSANDHIRKVSNSHCNLSIRPLAEEEENLRIRFYEGFYEESFGSIFPKVDIVSLVPAGEADVAILEEPEHLNWFRVPSAASDNDATGDGPLGWAQKFHHSVGILHTNYDAYLRQYAGMGTSVVAAPALNGLSSLVVRAYCRRVIRLSDALPSLDTLKELTCNVHGVRNEFFDTQRARRDGQVQVDARESDTKVYFIGKLIFAKGFDDVLQLQEKVREVSGKYFAIDIYGGGKDQNAIQRSFLGRKQTDDADREELDGGNRQAADIFCDTRSLREKVWENEDAAEITSATRADSDDEAVGGNLSDEGNPLLGVLGELSSQALGVGAETADASYQLLETSVRTVFGRSKKKEGVEEDDSKSNPMALIPRQAQYKWRRDPIPARFTGVVDHIALRGIPERYIFLNMSKSEVLCTTTAEALAMGKFVIIPKHCACIFVACILAAVSTQEKHRCSLRFRLCAFSSLQ